METTTKDYRDGFWHGANMLRAYGLPRLRARIALTENRAEGYEMPHDFLAGMIDAALEQAQRSNG